MTLSRNKNSTQPVAPPPTPDTRHPTPGTSPRWVESLLQWFSIHQRTMPWRDDPSPYKVWISEIMLQQTRVTAVIPYFERFIARFPDVNALANAPQEKVLKAWEGLGYYSRARNLHQAAKVICFERQGIFPETEEEWSKLPGVGPYTSAAVSSIACGQAAAAIDGNVMRVWSRLRGIREDITAISLRNKARNDLIRYTKQCNPSLFNQAMMELGALVCLPRNPACKDCPIRTICTARRKNLTDVIPFRKKAGPVPHRDEIVLVIARGGNVLMRQRPAQGLLAGLWEFPALPKPAQTKSSRKAARDFAKSMQVPTTATIKPFTKVDHAFTHFTQKLHVFLIDLSGSAAYPTPDGWCWCSPVDLESLPLSRTQRQIANLCQ